MARELHPENLKSIKTKEQAKAWGKRGGIKSGKAKRQKKLLSQIYAELLAKKHKMKDKDGNKIEIYGDELAQNVAAKILSRTDGASVSMLREIREATEGSKVIVSGVDEMRKDIEKALNGED